MRTRTAFLAGQAAALGLMMAFLVVPASALFLVAYGARTLPWAYLVVAPAGIVTSALVTRAGRRVSLATLAGGLVVAYLAVVALCWLALVGSDAVWPTFVLVVLFPLAIPVGFVAVGSQAVRLFTIPELKSRFPRVVAGFPIGFAVGGLVAGLLGGAVGRVANLLLLGLLAGLGMLWLVVRTAREFPGELLARPEPTASAVAGEPTSRRAAVLRDPLVAAVLGYQVLSGAVTQLLDYLVWDRAAASFPDAQALARFQGLYGSALNVASILFVALAASWLLRRYGVRLGLSANPALVLAACLVMLAVGEVAGIVGLGFLAMACLAQVADIATTDGLTRGSVAVTYQAMPPERRLPAQSMAEGAGTPVAIGLAGALLLAIQALDLDVLAVVWLVVVLSAGWLVLARFTYRSYGPHLADVLRHGSWDPAALRVDGPAAEAMVARLLASADPDDRVTGLEALVDSDSSQRDGELARALRDEDPRVRGPALDLVVPSFTEHDGLVRDAVAALVGPTDEGVRAAALLTGRGGGRDGRSDERAVTVWAEAIAGADAALAEAAAKGAAAAPHPSRVPHLLAVAGRPSPPVGIVEALAAHVDHLGPTLRTLWLSTPDPASEDGRRRAVVATAVAGAGRSAAREWLLARLDGPGSDRDDLRLVVGALVPRSWSREPTSVPARVLARPLAAEVRRVRRALVGLEQLRRAATPGARGRDAGRGVEIATAALRDEVEEARRHVEVLFGASACPRGTAWFVRALGGPDPGMRAAAIELAETTLGRRQGPATIAVLDPGLDDDARVRALDPLAGDDASQAADPLTALTELTTDPDGRWDSAWLRACVLRALPSLSPDHAARAARSLADDPDPVVAQTAAWVLGCGGP